MATEHKFCVDCAHYRFTSLPMGGPVFIECLHPSAPRDPVHGNYSSCHEQRLSVLHCGPDGTRWQRKPVDKPQPPPNRKWRALPRWMWPW